MPRPTRMKARTKKKTAARAARARPVKLADLPDLLTVEEFMQATRIKRTSAYAMVREKQIPVVRIGRHVRIPREVLEQRAS